MIDICPNCRGPHVMALETPLPRGYDPRLKGYFCRVCSATFYVITRPDDTPAVLSPSAVQSVKRT